MMNAQLSAQFEQQIALKKQSYTAAQRELLTKVLDEKYKDLSVSEKLKSNLNSLKEAHTFTITTGHQLCFMTGPLYFIYKILHVIKLSEDLNNTFPNEHFVPVYWMASEDHDFEEIRSFLLFGQKWTWESSQKGAVGQFDTNDLQPLLQALSEKFQNQADSEIHHLIENFKTPNYGSGFFEFVHELLGAQSGIGGGGRYDGLMEQLGGQSLSGIGFGLGVDRALLAAEAEGVIGNDAFVSDLFIIPLGEAAKVVALTIAADLRAHGKIVEIAFGDRALKGAMKGADKSGATHVIVLGESEISSGTVELKEMKSGHTSSVKIDSLLEAL